MQGLGIMHAAGIHVNSSQAKALVFVTFAALGGDEMAQMILVGISACLIDCDFAAPELFCVVALYTHM